MTTTIADMSELDLTISQLKAATTELKLKRTALQRFVTDQKTFLKPVHSLPAEVLSQIFQRCIIVS